MRPTYRRLLPLVPAFLLVLSVVGCGGGEDTADRSPAGTPPRAGSGASGTEGSAAGSATDWQARRSGLPQAGDPRLDDPAFLRGLQPSAPVYLALGDLYYRRADGDSAIHFYRLADALAPREAVIQNALGLAYKNFGYPAEAESTLLEAAGDHPLDIHTHVNLGNLYFLTERMDRAVAEYRIATGIDSTFFNAWFNLGLAYEKQGEANPAILAHFKAIDCDPDDPKPYERIGNLYYEAGTYKQARQKWQEAIDRDPTRDDLRDKIRMLQDYADTTGTG